MVLFAWARGSFGAGARRRSRSPPLAPAEHVCWTCSVHCKVALVKGCDTFAGKPRWLPPLDAATAVLKETLVVKEAATRKQSWRLLAM